MRASAIARLSQEDLHTPFISSVSHMNNRAIDPVHLYWGMGSKIYETADEIWSELGLAYQTIHVKVAKVQQIPRVCILWL